MHLIFVPMIAPRYYEYTMSYSYLHILTRTPPGCIFKSLAALAALGSSPLHAGGLRNLSSAPPFFVR